MAGLRSTYFGFIREVLHFEAMADIKYIVKETSAYLAEIPYRR